jgi:lipopolysaccharide transport system permease protein
MFTFAWRRNERSSLFDPLLYLHPYLASGRRCMSTLIEPFMDSIARPQQPSLPSDGMEPCTTQIRPPVRWQLINARELWHARELLYFLIWRDVKIRYKQTVLGAAWAILQPALMMVVFTIFFGRMAGMAAGAGDHYSVFVLAGLLPWVFFSTAIANAGNSVVGAERMITKIYFPRLAIPFASVGAAVFDFGVSCGLLALMMAIYMVAPSPQLFLAPLLFVIILTAALGLGALVAALNVAYRDFRYVVPFLLQVGMFATPTIYTQPDAHSSPTLQFLLVVNPMTGLIGAFRSCVLGGDISWLPVAQSAAVVFLLFAASCLYFRHVEDTFADII